ncbi:hypothetical protein D3C78_1579240 [compost metagenome]
MHGDGEGPELGQVAAVAVTFFVGVLAFREDHHVAIRHPLHPGGEVLTIQHVMTDVIEAEDQLGDIDHLRHHLGIDLFRWKGVGMHSSDPEGKSESNKQLFHSRPLRIGSALSAR